MIAREQMISLFEVATRTQIKTFVKRVDDLADEYYRKGREDLLNEIADAKANGLKGEDDAS